QEPDEKPIDKQNSWKIWHQRVGHVNSETLKRMVNAGSVENMRVTGKMVMETCDSCHLGKAHKVPLHIVENEQSKNVLDLFHSDLNGAMGKIGFRGYEYFVLLIDDFTHYVTVYLLHSKDEVFKFFQQYEARMTNLHGRTIKIFRSDGGGEFCSNEF